MKIGLGIGIPKRQSSSGGGSSFDNDYQALLDAASGDLPGASVQTAQNTLVVDLKAAGAWDKLDLFYVFATDGGDDIRRRNWKAPASFQATLVNAPTFTSLEGYAGDGSTSYIDTGWSAAANGVNYGLTSVSLGAYTRTNLKSSSVIIGARDAGPTNLTYLLPQLLNDRIAGFSNTNSGTINTTTTTTSAGLTWVNRSDSNNDMVYRNGNLFSTQAHTTSQVFASNLYIAALNDNGTAVALDARQISIAFVGGDLSSEAAAFFTAINKYMTAIGKNV